MLVGRSKKRTRTGNASPHSFLPRRLLDSHPRLALLGFFLTGASLTFAFAPFGAWPLAPVALLPMMFAALAGPPRRAARLGFAFGFGLFLGGTYWIAISIHVFGNAPLPLAVFLMLAVVTIMAGWIAACGWLLARVTGGRAWRLLAAGPGAWVLVEWLRGWVASGFPWLSLGYSQVDSPLAAWLPLVGVFGVSFLVALTAAALALAILGRRPAVCFAVAALPWVAGIALGQVGWTAPAGPAIQVTLVQGGVGQERKWLPEQFRPTLLMYRDSLAAARDSDVVVWPEVAIPALDTQVEPFVDVLRDTLRPGQTLLYGILEQDGDEIHNSVVSLDSRGRQVYRKRHLVPFGEYFPVPEFVREWMRLMSLPHSDLSAGAAVQPLITTVGGQRLAVAICYEDAYGNEQLYAFPDDTLIVNVSNDAWFGDSIAPHQHLEIARVRAMEVGRPLIRATNNGISVFVGPDGAILDRAAQFEYATLTRDVVPMQGTTPYIVAGNWPVVTLAVLLLAAARLRRPRRRR